MNKENKSSKLIIIIITIIFILSSYSIYSSYSSKKDKIENQIPTTNNNNNQSTNRFDYIFSGDASLKNAQQIIYKNDDIIARLEIPNMFNIFITQTDDNEYYLNHSIRRKKDEKGTEYMDYRVTPTSKQINIYGHNSKTYNLPFSNLEKFLNETFFNNNKYILLQHAEGRRIYEILSIKEVTTDYTHMKVNVKKEKFVNHINTLKKDSIFSRDITYDENSNILVLQTCSYEKEDSFYILVAIEVDTN